MLWGLLVVLATAYAVVTFGCALAVLLSRPKIPHRPSFFEIHNRAIRMRDVVLPVIAAAILGFFVSLAASFAHEGFSSPLADRYELSGTTYVYLTIMGTLLSLLGLVLTVEKVRGDAISAARHPASINRAAEVLLLGKEIEGLESRDLERNLTHWQARAAKSATRIILWRGESPNMNRLLQSSRRDLRGRRLPEGFTTQLFIASIRDYPTRGILAICGFVVSFLAGVLAASLSVVSGWDGGGLVIGIGLPLAVVLLQLVSACLYLRFNARFVARCWRIDEIELLSARRRIKRLMRPKLVADSGPPRRVSSFMKLLKCRRPGCRCPAVT